MCMDVIHYKISWGPQFEEVSFMDLNHRGNPIKAQDGPMGLLCTELICHVALVTSLRQGFHLHSVFDVEFSNLFHNQLILIPRVLEICLLGDGIIPFTLRAGPTVLRRG